MKPSCVLFVVMVAEVIGLGFWWNQQQLCIIGGREKELTKEQVKCLICDIIADVQ